MQPWPLMQALLLVALANGLPLVATRLVGPMAAWPIDGGRTWPDGRPVLGRSKTWRGLVLGTAGPAVVAPLLGLPWSVGALAGVAAMLGDLVSSFLKRRFQIGSGGRALALDQVPEALLPLLACRDALGLGLGEVMIGTALFWAGGVALSPLLYRLGIRERPY